MFQPFTSPTQFYPGLILWCDAHSVDMERSTLAPGEEYDHRKAREPKPCLVVAVDHSRAAIQVARICATTPTDTRKWVRIDTAPPITWRLVDAWIWVGKPGTVRMVFNEPRIMHPHKQSWYSTNPIAAANLQSYWVHRNNYLMWRSARESVQPDTHGYSANPHPVATLYAAPPHSPAQMSPGHNSVGGSLRELSQFAGPSAPRYHLHDNSPPLRDHGPLPPPAPAAFGTLSEHPVVVPAGFTEQHSSFPGWWRNPATGWFWHARRGLRPPPAS